MASSFYFHLLLSTLAVHDYSPEMKTHQQNVVSKDSNMLTHAYPKPKDHRQDMSYQICKVLTPGVTKYLWWRLKTYGFMSSIERDELSQYIRIATWKALVEQPDLIENSTLIGLKIYNKLLDLLRNVGKDQLGLGLRKQNGCFWKQTIRGIDLDAGVRLHCLTTTEMPIDRLARDMALDQMIQQLESLETSKQGTNLSKRLRLAKTNRLTSLVMRAKRTLLPLLLQATKEVDSPAEGFRLFQEALDHFKLSRS
jgi:hypothetical protein